MVIIYKINNVYNVNHYVQLVIKHKHVQNVLHNIYYIMVHVHKIQIPFH